MAATEHIRKQLTVILHSTFNIELVRVLLQAVGFKARTGGVVSLKFYIIRDLLKIVYVFLYVADPPSPPLTP